MRKEGKKTVELQKKKKRYVGGIVKKRDDIGSWKMWELRERRRKCYVKMKRSEETRK